MKPRKEHQVKRFEDLLPKLDNGMTDWESVKTRLSQNVNAAEMFLGQLPPQAIEIEQTVLGACLIDPTAYAKAKEVLAGFATPFYLETHNAIWSAMGHLTEKNTPIDRLTVWDELEKMQQWNHFQKNAYFLVELTEVVASSAHVESHSRILLEKCLRRRIMHQSILLFKKSLDASTDLFGLIDEQKLMFNSLTEFCPVLKSVAMPEVMKNAKKATTKSFLMGSFIKIEDVAILFSGPGNGKSILGVQMADAISKGMSLLNGILVNECGPLKVMYFDFELTLNDYKSRYLDAAGDEYAFADNDFFRRVGNDDNNSKTFAEIARNMERILLHNIELYHPKVVFIDNITAMSNGSTADAVVATKIMDLLIHLKKQHQLTVLVLAHTPKRYDLSKPLAQEDLAGSALIAAYADSIFAIGPSKMGSNVKYLKHLKIRTGVKIHDEHNVIQVAIEKEGAFLQLKTLEEPFGRENDHLVSKNEIVISDETIHLMVASHDEGKSNQVIKEELKLSISRQYIGRIIKMHKEKKKAEATDVAKASIDEAPF
jgi:hypothetical protein